jgi:hypothetical protein
MKRFLTGTIAALALAACDGGDGAPGGATEFGSLLQGSWTRCDNGGAYDVHLGYAFDGDRFEYHEQVHATNDGSCGGAPTSRSASPGTFSVGAAVTTTFGPDGASITAHQMDFVDPEGSWYDLFYVDTALTPHRLYRGGYPGATADPALRPTYIETDSFLARQ